MLYTCVSELTFKRYVISSVVGSESFAAGYLFVEMRRCDGSFFVRKMNDVEKCWNPHYFTKLHFSPFYGVTFVTMARSKCGVMRGRTYENLRFQPIKKKASPWSAASALSLLQALWYNIRDNSSTTKYLLQETARRNCWGGFLFALQVVNLSIRPDPDRGHIVGGS